MPPRSGRNKVLSTSQVNELSKFYLHDAVYLSIKAHLDAVYLYLLAVNQTLAEGYTDFRDGRLIFSKTIGQRFVGRNKSSLG